MKILIVSDTHGMHRNYAKMLEIEGRADKILHLGDTEGGELYIERTAPCPVYFVAGNNDGFSELRNEALIQIGAYKVFMTHGHRYHVSMDTRRLKEEAVKRGAQIVFYGHTHRPDIDLEGPVYCVNPGSLSYPRQSGRRPTYIVMEIDDDGRVDFTLKSL